MNKIFFTFCLLIIANNFSVAQDSAKINYLDPKNQFDVKDLLRDIFHPHEKKTDTLKTTKKKEKLSLSLLPGISYDPATGLIIGVSTELSWFYGNPNTTKNSSISAGISVTTKKQIKFSVHSEIFTSNNTWLLGGDLRYWKFSQDTYGLGTGTPASNSQNMDFNFIRFEENLLYKVSKNLYAGIGFYLDSYNKIKTINPDNDSIIYPSFNSSYSQENNLDTSGYIVSGFAATTNYDSRDNTINPYKGILFELTYVNFSKAFGSTTYSNKLEGQIRAYKSWNKNDSYITAFWLYGGSILGGTMPYMTLPAIGWDKYDNTGRGYVQGRFRGKDFLYFEFENRITITKNRFFGMVAFVNASTLSAPESGVKLFQYIAPAGGLGLRFLFDKDSRTNLCVDYAVGIDVSSGLYLSMGEIF